MTSIAFDIVLRPSSKLADLAYAVSANLKDKHTYFALKEGKYYVHASLYMVQLDIDRIESVKKLLQELARTTKSVKLIAKEFHQEGGYFDVEYERNEIIDGIQNRIIGLINPLRDGLRKKDEERIKTATGMELENLQKYGYRSIGSEFAPHITFTRFVEVGTKQNINNDLREFDGDFTSIGLFEMGDNGTCVRKLLEIPLGQ
ncbi:MAG: DUF1045 domain-containing protein [Candidatus Saccharibacteria bacterium]